MISAIGKLHLTPLISDTFSCAGWGCAHGVLFSLPLHGCPDLQAVLGCVGAVSVEMLELSAAMVQKHALLE